MNIIADEVDDVQNEKFTKWELPKRIFAPICRGHVRISDCVFKDEGSKDILNRILELMGVSVEEEELISEEKFAGDVSLSSIISIEKLVAFFKCSFSFR